jgi:hypothetical protein
MNGNRMIAFVAAILITMCEALFFHYGTLWRVAYRGDARTASGGGETARDIGN